MSIPFITRTHMARKLGEEAAERREFERWMPVRGFESSYEASDYGRVRSLISGRLIARCVSNSGYYYARLWMNNKGRSLFVHRLILDAFLPSGLEVGFQVNHKDGVKLNNLLGNLEAVTPSENLKHAVHVLGFQPPVKRGIENHNARAVVRLTLSGDFAQHYACQADAVRDGYRAACITECCRGTQKTHAGFCWMYADERGTAGGRVYGWGRALA